MGRALLSSLCTSEFTEEALATAIGMVVGANAVLREMSPILTGAQIKNTRCTCGSRRLT